jgi:hypothetical protein
MVLGRPSEAGDEDEDEEAAGAVSPKKGSIAIPPPCTQTSGRRKLLKTGRGTGRVPKTYKTRPPRLSKRELQARIAEVQAAWSEEDRVKRRYGLKAITELDESELHWRPPCATPME